MTWTIILLLTLGDYLFIYLFLKDLIAHKRYLCTFFEFMRIVTTLNFLFSPSLFKKPKLIDELILIQIIYTLLNDPSVCAHMSKSAINN